MAATKSITYSTASGNWSYVVANSSTKKSISIPVTTKIPEKAKITKITFTFLVRAASMGNAYTWYLNYFAIGSESNGSPYAQAQSSPAGAQGNDAANERTFSGELIFTQDDIAQFQKDSFTVYCNATHNKSGVNCEYNKITITVEYEEETSHTVSCHNGTEWVQYEVYCHDGENWVLCDPYYHNGTDWVLVDTQ